MKKGENKMKKLIIILITVTAMMLIACNSANSGTSNVITNDRDISEIPEDANSDDENTNNNEYIKHWTYKQLNMIGHVFSIENLYHFINLEFKHVGPKNADNYLLIFDIVSRKEFAKNLKATLLHAFIYIVIAIILVLFL